MNIFLHIQFNCKGTRDGCFSLQVSVVNHANLFTNRLSAIWQQEMRLGDDKDVEIAYCRRSCLCLYYW